MQDIALECGISMMTVSRVLRGKTNVSPATRDMVLDAAKRLNYESNVLAQNFVRRRSGFIGVAAPFQGLVGSSYFGEILNGFQRVKDGDERHFALFDTHSSSFKDGQVLGRLCRTRTVEGMLVIAPNANDKFLDALSEIKIPLIVVGKEVANRDIMCVSCDDARGIELVCEHLHALGHRRIAFIGGPLGFSVAQAREHAYTAFCRRKRFRIPAEYLQRGVYDMRSGREMGALLLGLPNRPTAIIAANDMMALGVLEMARELNIAVPMEISVAGFDDLPTAADHFPALTTVHQPVGEMAELGARLLLEWLDTGKAPERQETLGVTLVVRHSTTAVR